MSLITPLMSFSFRRCMITTMADLSELTRVGRVSVKAMRAASSLAALLALSALIGSSRMTLSPRTPVMLVKARACRMPFFVLPNSRLPSRSASSSMGQSF